MSAFVHIADAKVHDVRAMDLIPYESGAYYIFDSGYVENERLNRITQLGSNFVIRSKKNMQFECSEYRPVDVSTGVISDQVGSLVGFYVSKQYPEKFKKVVFYDVEMERTFVFITNNLELPSEQIALLYKIRWQIELFFKWIKQYLKIKSFWGTSENAVRIQIYSAIITYCMVVIVGHDLKLERSTYEILTVLGISLLDKTPVKEPFSKIDNNDVKDLYINQLTLNLF